MQVHTADPTAADAFDDEFETVGDYHRKAAHYFTQAAHHHLAAAAADDDGDETALELHAFKAYRHQLNGVQCAEIAVMEGEDEGADMQGVDEVARAEEGVSA
jgi:hypothetical protein